MEFAICSYSFHRTMAAGQMDFAGYVSICRDLGCAQLDPWNAHLLPAEKGGRRNLRQPESEPVAIPPAA